MPPTIHPRHKGFSLVELMVGLAVGLVASLAIVQTMSLFEAQKRTTNSGSEAQENGLVSIAMLEQDIHNAGSGLAEPSPFDCTNFYTYLNSGAITGFNLAPVAIVDGGAGASDTISIRYTTNFLSSLPAFLTADTSAASPFPVSRTFGFSTSNLALIVQGANCTLFNVSAIDSSASTLTHAPASSSPNLNPASAYITSNGWPDYIAGAKVFNIDGLVTHTYSVNNGNLQVVESTLNGAGQSSTTTPLVSNVVNLQAQYGIAPAGSTNVTQWVDATGSTWATPSSTDRKRIKALRIVVVTRTTAIAPTNVTNTCTTDSGIINNGPCAWKADSATSPAPAIDLSGNADWQRYRYRTYQTIIPLRNVIWTNL